MTTAALIPAAGHGLRLGAGPKALLTVGDRTLLRRVVDIVAPLVEEVWIACPRGMEATFREQAPGCRVIAGGATRQESVAILLRSCTATTLLVHDVTRPFTSRDLCRRALETGTGRDYAAAFLEPEVPALLADGESGPMRVLPRHAVRLLQSPQVVSRNALVRAYEYADASALMFQSTLELMLAIGVEPVVVTGEKDNLKITTIEDLEYARYLAARSQPASSPGLAR